MVSEEELVQRGYRITGRVQGVFFRAWTRQKALELGLRGTVRNRFDGSVEACVLGSPAVLEVFQARLWEG
ncbi:acylphosphatase, partial [Gemmatimonadota bacterium]